MNKQKLESYYHIGSSRKLKRCLKIENVKNISTNGGVAYYIFFTFPTK